MELGSSYDFFSAVDIRWCLLIWGDNNWGIQQNTRFWYFVVVFFLCVCLLFDKLTGFLLFICYLTQNGHYSSFLFLFFSETKSTWPIQLPIAGILCHGLKFAGIFRWSCIWFSQVYMFDLRGCMLLLIDIN